MVAVAVTGHGGGSSGGVCLEVSWGHCMQETCTRSHVGNPLKP